MSRQSDPSVYFIDLGPYIKVGVSRDPEKRCEKLFQSSTHYSAPWDCPKHRDDRRLLGYVDGDLGDERRAHLALDDFAVGCEFFLNEEPVRAYIAKCLKVGRIYRRPVKRPQGPAEWVGQTVPDPDRDRKMRESMARWDFLTGGAA